MRPLKPRREFSIQGRGDGPLLVLPEALGSRFRLEAMAGFGAEDAAGEEVVGAGWVVFPFAGGEGPGSAFGQGWWWGGAGWALG